MVTPKEAHENDMTFAVNESQPTKIIVDYVFDWKSVVFPWQ